MCSSLPLSVSPSSIYTQLVCVFQASESYTNKLEPIGPLFFSSLPLLFGLFPFAVCPSGPLLSFKLLFGTWAAWLKQHEDLTVVLRHMIEWVAALSRPRVQRAVQSRRSDCVTQEIQSWQQRLCGSSVWTPLKVKCPCFLTREAGFRGQNGRRSDRTRPIQGDQAGERRVGNVNEAAFG